ncbi:MAG TPA: M56 family metallopeptidase [Terriglobales bacterium]|jgi:Zn-dependent protease with chaperone function|nr:M56 family metallopeptidase [Terriglobales bacterium]
MIAALLNPPWFDLQSLAQLSAERILNCAAEGMGIALAAWILLRVIGRQNSGTRFAVWFAALLGIAALPLAGYLAPNSAGLARRSEITMPASWALYIFAGWALVAAAGLIRVGIGFWHLHRLRTGCVPVDMATLDPVLRQSLDDFHSPRQVTFCVSDHLRVPTAIGFIRPRVVLPSWTMRELSVPELNTILLHELAHLRRWDDWTNFVQKIVGALLFFHPAVWWIDRRLALEREMACDDLVLAKTASPRMYAECLVSLAEKSFVRRGVALAQAAVNRLRHVSLRVVQILDENRPGATRVWRPAPLLLTGISLTCLMTFSAAPRLVSFENASASPAAGPATTILSRTESSEAPRLGSNVVPAKFVLKPPARSLTSRGLAARSFVSKTASRSANQPAVIPAKVTQRRTKPPALIRSSLTQREAYRTVIFVVQTQVLQTEIPESQIVDSRNGMVRDAFLRSRPDDASNPAVWNLRVWRITLIGPNRDMVEQGLVIDSI